MRYLFLILISIFLLIGCVEAEEKSGENYYEGIWSSELNYLNSNDNTIRFLSIKKIESKYFIIFSDLNKQENIIWIGDEKNNEIVFIGKYGDKHALSFSKASEYKSISFYWAIMPELLTEEYYRISKKDLELLSRTKTK